MHLTGLAVHSRTPVVNLMAAITSPLDSIRRPLGLSPSSLWGTHDEDPYARWKKKNTYGINNSIEITCVQDNNEIKGRASKEFCWSFMLRCVSCISQLEVQRRSMKNQDHNMHSLAYWRFALLEILLKLVFLSCFLIKTSIKKQKIIWDPLWMKELQGVCELMKS